MQEQFSTVVQPSQSMEGPRLITSVSSTAHWEHTDSDGKTNPVLLDARTTNTQLPNGHRLTLPASAQRPVMVTGLQPTPPTPPTPSSVPEVTVTVYG
jgi:hypothetical protein